MLHIIQLNIFNNKSFLTIITSEFSKLDIKDIQKCIYCNLISKILNIEYFKQNLLCNKNTMPVTIYIKKCTYISLITRSTD